MATQPGRAGRQLEYSDVSEILEGAKDATSLPQPQTQPNKGAASVSDDTDAANILEQWDRARAAEDASVRPTGGLEAETGSDGAGGCGAGARASSHQVQVCNRNDTCRRVGGVTPTPGHLHDEEALLGRRGFPEDLTLGLLTPARHQANQSQVARLRLASTDGRGRGFPSVSSMEPSSSEASPRELAVRKAKQRRNSYSVPQASGFDIAPSPLGPSPASISLQGAPPAAPDSARSSRRAPLRRNTHQNLQLPGDGLQPTLSVTGSQLARPSGRQSGGGVASPGSPASCAAGSRDQPTPAGLSSSGAGPFGADPSSPQDGTGIRRKLIKMISLQRPKQRAVGSMRSGAQVPPALEVPDGPAAPGDTDDEEEAPVPTSARTLPHDSDEEDVEEVRPDGPVASRWNGVSGPSPSELRMMGATNSVSFKKSTMKQGVLRPLATLPPFVPRLFVEDAALNHEKYKGFDAAGRDLTAASKSLQPSIIELQAAVMIADVTGFTKLTEILSKKGTSGVELLTTCMNNYFTRAINMIMAYEGDVVKFAGDSMIVLFYPNEHERRHADKGLRACTMRMVACAHQLAARVGHMRMKMNGQVEPAPPPPPEPTAAPIQVQPAVLSAPLVSVPGSGLISAPSADLTPEQGEAGQADLLRNNSTARRAGRDSPRSSTTNQPTMGSGTGEEGASPLGTDGAVRTPDGSDAPQMVPTRRRGKSWNLMANILKGNKGIRRSEINMTPGSMSPAGASSSGPSRGSFEKNQESRTSTRMLARERAKTETGLGVTLRGSIGGGGSGVGTEGSNGSGAGLWAGGDAIVRRELSVATKLNLPPPLRPMQQRVSQTLSPLNVSSSAAAGPHSQPLASGVYPGSGSALAGLANGGPSAAGSPRSFTEQHITGSGGSFRRAPLGARSERRITGGPALATAGATGDWRVKLQNLSTAIVQSPTSTGPPGEELAPQRSRLSESARAVRWDTVQEEDGSAEEMGTSDAEVEDDAEDASYPPIQADAMPSMSSIGQPLHLGRAASSGPSSGVVPELSGASSPAERSYSAAGSQSAVLIRGPHSVDLRRKLLLRNSHSEREDANGRRFAAALPPREEPGSGLGAGPIAEATEDASQGRSRVNSDTDALQGGGDVKQGSFFNKVVNWFGNTAGRKNGYVDSFSNHPAAPQPNAANGQPDFHGDSPGSQPPSANGSASNSFNYTTGLASGMSRVPMPNIAMSGPLGKAPRGDPIMEEVSNSRLSLKVMTSAGSVCVFHVGGGVDEVITDPALPEVPRWEFFIGDRPLAPLMDANQRRRCINQVAAIEDQATAGSVVASIEVVELIQGDWDVVPLPDSVWRVVGPLGPALGGWGQNAQPQVRLSHTSLRTSATSHTPNLRNSDVVIGSSGLPHAAEAVEDLAALQVLRNTSSITNGQPPINSSVGQPLSALANRSHGTSLNGSSDRPTNGSGPDKVHALLQGHSFAQQPQSLLASVTSQSGNLGPDGSAVHASSIERAPSGPSGTVPANTMIQLHSNSQGLLHSAGPPPAAAGQPPPPPALSAAAAQLPPRLRHEFVNLSDHVQRRIAGLLRMHVLGSVRIRVEAGHLDFINEIRPLTCMFLGFPSLLTPRDDVSHKDQVNCVQLAYTSVQAVMRKWDGSFLQFRSDEKGFVGICAFGLPGHTHEDNPTRGIKAAIELASVIRAAGHRLAVGVTTGDLLCTCVGARKLRSEYTVFGDAINLSARLMVKCKKDESMGEILCDEPTYARAKYQAAFIELERLPVKGKEQPVQVYRVGAHDATAEAAAAQQRREAAEVSSGERPLIGRDAEMTLTLNHAASMISGMSHGGVIVIEGNTGMGKTKLLMEVRKSLERINVDTSISSRPAFHMVFGMADTANKSQKLHPWRRVFQELFALDYKLRNLGAGGSPSTSAATAGSSGGTRRAVGATSMSGQGQGLAAQTRRRGTDDGPSQAVFTVLGERLSRVPNYDTEWRQHLSELLDLPLCTIPLGQNPAETHPQLPEEVAVDHEALQMSFLQTKTADAEGVDVPPLATGIGMSLAIAGPSGDARDALTMAAGSMLRTPPLWRTPSVRHASVSMPGPPPVVMDAHGSTLNIAAATASVVIPGAAGAPSPPHVAGHNAQVGAPIKKNSLNFLVHVMQEFISLYGPTLVLLENLHDFDTWSWQLLVKAAEVLTTDCMILATTRPNDLPAVGPSHHLHGKAALYQKVAMMYRHLLKLPTAERIVLEPFSFQQTKSLMQVVADINYPDQYVLAVMEKTGGMPLYIEKVTEFLCQSQKPWLPDQGGEFSANVNKQFKNLNFQQVIIERMDRLKPGIHLSLKVASVMGQWVDLDILHKFYPINKSKDELRSHLQELERGNFLKPTDAEGVWEFNMVERDIVYEVIPHYQRRRLHAKLAQELEKSLEEQHVATLTTIAYHWNQACMGHEVAEVECSLKAIEYWHRAAEAAYGGSSLMEALKLYQKAAQIAEILAESMGGSVSAGDHHPLAKRYRHGDGHGDAGAPREGGEGGAAGTSSDGRIEGTDQSFTAVGSAFKGLLNWALISRLSRSQWEKSMASCCLGIVLQHRYEFNNQLEYWDTEDYFRLLTEHAIRGLMLLGAPHPRELLQEDAARAGPLLGRLCSCFRAAGGSSAAASSQHGWASGLVLQDSEVQEIRDVLLVLIIAAEHYSLQHDGGEYTRLLTFCKRVCKFFNKCSDSGIDPFLDIRSACSSRIKNYKNSRALQTHIDFGINTEPALEAAAARNGPIVGPELSRAVLGLQRPHTPMRM